MCYVYAFILSFGLLVPSILAGLTNFSKGSQSLANDEETKLFDAKQNENIASNELTPVERKVLAVQEMIDQLKKYNAFWNKLSAAKSQESTEERSEDIPEAETYTSERRKRIKYVKKKNDKSEESIENNVNDSDNIDESKEVIDDISLSDDSDMVPTHIREKGNIFPKKRFQDDSSVSKSQNIDSDSFEKNDNDYQYFTTDTESMEYSQAHKSSMENTYNSEETNIWPKKNSFKISKNVEQKKSIDEKSSPKMSEEKSKQDEFENQLKGQKEIAQPIMFKNRSDGHDTSHKTLPSLIKIQQSFVTKYLPGIIPFKTTTGKTKQKIKIPESDENLSVFSVEVPPYDFQKQENHETNSDESSDGADHLDDILDPKGFAEVKPSSDESSQLRKNLALLDESNLKDLNKQSIEETPESQIVENENMKSNNEDKIINEQDHFANDLSVNDEAEYTNSNGGLGMQTLANLM